MTKLNDRIREDLTFLFQGKEIKRAVELSQSMEMAFSTRGEPAHYFGQRNAFTVMVMLNPGCEAEIANKKFKEVSKKWNRESLDSFIESYKRHKAKGTKCEAEKDKPDSFDVKQFAFLKPWHGCGIDKCGIDFPKDFKGKENKLNACKCVLQQKLQLELVPYASRTFAPKAEQCEYLIPYLEDCLEEIFSKERKYVVFCGRFFEPLFKDACAKKIIDNLTIDKKKVSLKKKKQTNGLSAWYSVVRFDYRKQERKVLIAHTFASRALTNAYELMERYGKYCFDAYKKC